MTVWFLRPVTRANELEHSDVQELSDHEYGERLGGALDHVQDPRSGEHSGAAVRDPPGRSFRAPPIRSGGRYVVLKNVPATTVRKMKFPARRMA